jgi:hypothetical protein
VSASISVTFSPVCCTHTVTRMHIAHTQRKRDACLIIQTNRAMCTPTPAPSATLESFLPLVFLLLSLPKAFPSQWVPPLHDHISPHYLKKMPSCGVRPPQLLPLALFMAKLRKTGLRLLTPLPPSHSVCGLLALVSSHPMISRGL